ncbi:MAG: hypothetical protein ABSF61_05265 [Anaerolineales bacterium]
MKVRSARSHAVTYNCTCGYRLLRWRRGIVRRYHVLRKTEKAILRGDLHLNGIDIQQPSKRYDITSVEGGR